MSRRESDPYERIVTRVEGIKAIGVLADSAIAGGGVIADGGVLQGPWHALWYFMGQVADEIEADARLLSDAAEVKS